MPPRKLNALIKQKQAELQKKMAGEWLQEEQEKYRQMHGTAPGIMANVTIMKNNTMRMQRELQKEKQRLQRIHGNVFESKDSAMSLLTTRRQMEACPPSVQGTPPLLRRSLQGCPPSSASSISSGREGAPC